MWKYRNTEDLYTDELYHYGIPGMKWGHRNNIYSNVQLAYKNRKKQINSTWKNAANGKLSDKAYDKAADKWISDRKAAKTKYKQDKKKLVKSNVNSYSKAYDKNMHEYDRADANNAKVKELYKKTGRNAVSRVINNMIGKSAAVKEYSKAYDKNMNEYDRADKNNKIVKKLRKKTGNNAISRTINTIKYTK